MRQTNRSGSIGLLEEWMWHRVDLVWSEISEELIASIFTVIHQLYALGKETPLPFVAIN
jgi:hypothetical protein